MQEWLCSEMGCHTTPYDVLGKVQNNKWIGRFQDTPRLQKNVHFISSWVVQVVCMGGILQLWGTAGMCVKCPKPTLVNVLGCPYQGSKWVLHPYMFSVNKGIGLPEKVGVVMGGGGAGVMYIARVAITIVVYFQLGCHSPFTFDQLYLSSK